MEQVDLLKLVVLPDDANGPNQIDIHFTTGELITAAK